MSNSMINLLYDFPSISHCFAACSTAGVILVLGYLLECYSAQWHDISKGHPTLGYQLQRKEAWAISDTTQMTMLKCHSRKGSLQTRWERRQLKDSKGSASWCLRGHLWVGDTWNIWRPLRSLCCLPPPRSPAAYTLTSGPYAEPRRGKQLLLCLLCSLCVPFPSSFWYLPTRTKYIIWGSQVPNKNARSFVQKLLRLSRWWQQSISQSTGPLTSGGPCADALATHPWSHPCFPLSSAASLSFY